MPSPYKVNEATEVQRIMAGLGISEEEAKEMYKIDREIDKNIPHDFDLTPEQEKIGLSYAKVTTKKRPANYQFTKRERKPNFTKRAFIEAIADLLQNMENVSDINLVNPEREIDFSSEGQDYYITLARRTKKKAK